MSAAIVKAKLKAARDALQLKDYNKARDAASTVLDYDPENYNANVFLGLALLELGDVKGSEQRYLKAVDANPDHPLAWQGLSKLYEQEKDLEKYDKSLYRLAEVFAKADDATKCAESLQKLLDLRRSQSKPLEVAEALSHFLPNSAFYNAISVLPPPDATNPTSTTTFFAQSAVYDSLPIVEEITSIAERSEDEKYNKEVENRRRRLGSPDPNEVRKEVGREIWGSSKLPQLYQDILNHPNTSDDLRRQTESKLLQHKRQLLFALPTSEEYADQKKALYEEVQEMVRGVVLLRIPNELAWILFMEGKDAFTIADYDYKILCQYVHLFPQSDLAKLLAAYFAYHNISTEESVSSDVGEEHQEGDEDYAAIIMDLFPAVRSSLIGHRCVGEIYQKEEDWENAMKVAESGLNLLRQEETNRGIKLPAIRRAFNVMLGVSLVHFLPPKHHTRALRIIDEVLSEDADNIPCLMGRGYIMQTAHRWAEASSAFRRVAELLPDDLQEGLRAQEEDAWCKVEAHDPETGKHMLQNITDILSKEQDRELDKARSWWRLGKCHWELGDLEEAYRCFITSLKCSSTFAPSFTSLGIYYLEVSSPPDPARASKCFQKAFELDPRETQAARRLAHGFAEEREWDLMEVVARRTIDGEGGLEGNIPPSRYLPLNAWAWKALGVVELNHQHYPQAIQAFQIALRADPEDSLSWLRLGEAYSKAGRFAAAVKSLERARELDPNDWISAYFLGDVTRQMGQFQEAIDIFLDVLEKVPSELRVFLSLAQSYLEFGRAQSAAGFNARAEASFVSSISVTLRSIDSTPGFRRIAWKISADALYELSGFSSFAQNDDVLSTIRGVLKQVTDHSHGRLENVLTFPIILSDSSSFAVAQYALQVALVAYDYRISLGSLNETSSASVYYDLGMALRSYVRKAPKGSSQDASQRESIAYLKEALRLDAHNDLYWSTLGSTLFLEQPKTAQHAYIQALEIDSKNARTWTSLGFLYLYHSDVELANEAFYRAQVLDPDFVPAWVGQGLIATVNGDHQEAAALFEHAVGMPVSVPEADKAFARGLFGRLSTSQHVHGISAEAFSPAFFVLDRFCRQRPRDATAKHLFGLICERLGHLDLAVEVIGEAIVLLEAAYEESEDPQIERQFAIAHTNMARLRLLRDEFDNSQESCQIVLGLLGELEGADGASLALLAQAQLWSGIAKFKQGQFDESLHSLEAAMKTAEDGGNRAISRHAVVIIAQIFWATGTEEGRETAKTRLLQSIDADPDNLTAVNTLAGMGVLTDDEGLVDAALSEILALPLDQRRLRDPQREVTYLLIQHHLGQADVQRAVSIAEKAVVVEPTQWQAEQQLATLQLQRHESASAQALLHSVLASSEGVAPLRESLPLVALAEACTDTAMAQKLAEKAVMLTPWDRRAWQVLAYSRSLSTDITK